MKFTSKKWFRWTFGSIVVICGGLGIFFGDSLIAVVKLATKLDLRETAPATYTADRNENLKSIHRALMLYHENEGQFPEASHWMDAIRPQLRPSDMKEGEEIKKLKNPLVKAGENSFGYIFNSALGAMNEGDIKDTSAVLVQESTTDTKYNASGKISEDKSLLGVTVAGEIVPTNAEKN